MLPSSPMLDLRLVHLLWAVLISYGLLVAHVAHAASSPEPLNIVVTIPVLKDLTEQVGGSHVRVTSLLNGYENEHTYSPKPSDLVAVRKARLLFEIGIGLEVWVTSLVKNAGSSTLQVVTTSSGIPLINHGHAHDSSRNHGDGANPHIWLDPENAAGMIRHMTDALMRADPLHAGDYERNTAAYLSRLDQLRVELDEQVRDLNERRFIAHHPAWPYLARRFGFEIAGTIQLQSGSEPSARHIQYLVQLMRKEKI